MEKKRRVQTKEIDKRMIPDTMIIHKRHKYVD